MLYIPTLYFLQLLVTLRPLLRPDLLQILLLSFPPSIRLRPFGVHFCYLLSLILL